MPRQRAQPPKSWPLDVTYLTAPYYSQALSVEQLESIRVACPSPKEIVIDLRDRDPVSCIRVVPITNSAHPANGQAGLFAAQHFQPDSFVSFYFGLVHTQIESDLKSSYDLSLDRELGIAIDATSMGNEARFINDYRGISPGPNAEFREVWVKTGKAELERRMAVFVLPAGKAKKRIAGIRKGEEILVSYGKAFWT